MHMLFNTPRPHATQLSSPEQWAQPRLTVCDADQPLVFTPEDVFRYHGYDAVGGAVLGFRLLQRAIQELSLGAIPERRDFSLFTAFPGLGARDCFELITRMVSDQRLTLDTSFTHTAAQAGLYGSFYFRFSYRGRSIALAPALGQPDEHFLACGRAAKRPGASPEDKVQWQAAKYALANLLLDLPCEKATRIL